MVLWFEISYSLTNRQLHLNFLAIYKKSPLNQLWYMVYILLKFIILKYSKKTLKGYYYAFNA